MLVDIRERAKRSSIVTLKRKEVSVMKVMIGTEKNVTHGSTQRYAKQIRPGQKQCLRRTQAYC